MMSKRRSYRYTVPNDVDILGGRRSEAFYHPGNRKLRGAIAALLDGYNSLTNPQARGAVVDGIVQSLKESGGRFLKFHTEVGVIDMLLAYSESLGPHLRSDPVAHTKVRYQQTEKWYDAGYAEAKKKIRNAFRDTSIPHKVKCKQKFDECSTTSGSQGKGNKQPPADLYNLGPLDIRNAAQKLEFFSTLQPASATGLVIVQKEPGKGIEPPAVYDPDPLLHGDAVQQAEFLSSLQPASTGMDIAYNVPDRSNIRGVQLTEAASLQDLSRFQPGASSKRRRDAVGVDDHMSKDSRARDSTEDDKEPSSTEEQEEAKDIESLSTQQDHGSEESFSLWLEKAYSDSPPSRRRTSLSEGDGKRQVALLEHLQHHAIGIDDHGQNASDPSSSISSSVLDEFLSLQFDIEFQGASPSHVHDATY